MTPDPGQVSVTTPGLSFLPWEMGAGIPRDARERRKHPQAFRAPLELTHSLQAFATHLLCLGNGHPVTGKWELLQVSENGLAVP